MEIESDANRIKRISRFVRSLRGGAQASLVLANDDARYALKFDANPQGENLLFNEALGSELYRALNLPTPHWAPIHVDDDFIDENEKAWFQLPWGKRRPCSGLHFGSRIIGDDPSLSYEIVPRSWFSKIQNRNQFWGALVVDVWAEHIDHRQAIFIKNPESGALTATFIDHGHLFRGASGRDEFRASAAMYLDTDVYWGEGASQAVEEWMLKIKTLNEDVIYQALAGVPQEWRAKSTEGVCERLLERRTQIEVLLSKEMVRLFRRRHSYVSTSPADEFSHVKTSADVAKKGSDQLRYSCC